MQSPSTSALHPLPWFLATSPSPHPEMVERPALADLLDRYTDRHRATIVTAPSGFGKTVAVAQWARRRRHRGQPGAVAWVTLSAGTGDIHDLVRGVLTALQRSARERGDVDLHRALATVYDSGSYHEALAAVGAMDTPAVTVVIDDFHKATTVTESDLADLIEYGPQWLHLVMITTDPVDSKLGRLKVHGQVATIKAADLSLSTSEIQAAAALVGRDIGPGRAQAVQTITAGWPAAVRLMLTSGADVPAAESGTELMTEYIRTTVLDRLRSEVAEFVLSTTVSARMDGRLATVLSGRPDAERLIAECLSAGLFLERFDAEVRENAVYQWHSMFATHCQAILRRYHPARWRELNRLAARELADADPVAAVDHAIHADDCAIAQDIVAGHWLELLLQSRWRALDELCGRMLDAFGELPEVLMIRACCRSLIGDGVGAATQFDRAGMLAAGGDAARRLRFIADLSCVLVADDEDEMSQAVQRAEDVLGDRTVVGPRVYACTLFVLGWAKSRLRYGSDRGSELLTAAVNECSATGLFEVATRARQNQALATAHAGEFDRALSVLHRDTSDVAGEPGFWLAHDGAGIERFAAGWVNFWRGELDSAREDFTVVAGSVGAGYPDMACQMLAFTVATLADRRAARTVQAAVARMADVDTHGVPFSSYKQASLARLAELNGEPAKALDLARPVADRDNLPMVAAVLSGMCRRLGDPELARAFANNAVAHDVPDYLRASGMLTLALLDIGSSPDETTHERLEEMLALAAPQRVRYP
ncbi:AAA family ATPase, partial [Micromonospora sp. WMMD737]|uniref:AAA family ATPase n=1 Tax=Micromonospora sp. WMMD737 TaxID=3404113 RepID=UPI003B926B3F